jgi:hypothetical protein
MIASSFERAGSLEAAGVEFIDENGGGRMRDGLAAGLVRC